MIKMQPWVSNNFSEGNSKYGKLLLLGESHYGFNRSNNSMITTDVINDIINGVYCKEYRYFTMLGKIFNESDRSDVFINCAFANLIQDVLQKPRVKPTEEELATISEAFWEILRITKPEKVIVTSKRAWDYWLPDHDPRGTLVSEISSGGKLSTVWKYQFEDVNCEAIGIGHPSGRNFYSWSGVVRSFVGFSE